jgi:hypothetical protein
LAVDSRGGAGILRNIIFSFALARPFLTRTKPQQFRAIEDEICHVDETIVALFDIDFDIDIDIDICDVFSLRIGRRGGRFRSGQFPRQCED